MCRILVLVAAQRDDNTICLQNLICSAQFWYPKNIRHLILIGGHWPHRQSFCGKKQKDIYPLATPPSYPHALTFKYLTQCNNIATYHHMTVAPLLLGTMPKSIQRFKISMNIIQCRQAHFTSFHKKKGEEKILIF